MAAQDCPITIGHAAPVTELMKDSRVAIRLYKYVCVRLGIWACLWGNGETPKHNKEIYCESRMALLQN